MAHLICQELRGYVAGPTKTDEGLMTVEARLTMKIDREHQNEF